MHSTDPARLAQFCRSTSARQARRHAQHPDGNGFRSIEIRHSGACAGLTISPLLRTFVNFFDSVYNEIIVLGGMASRAYDMSRRDRAVHAARQAALSAAYRLLAEPTSRALSVDDVARAAGVTRATLYNQFGSRSELLVAIFHDLGQRMQAERIYAAMRLPAPEEALSATLRESTRAYAREQAAIRKLFALAVLDREMQLEVERSERQRRQSLAHLAARLVAGGYSCVPVAETAGLLASLTSFQAFEALSFDVGPRLTERRLRYLVQASLGISNNRKGGEK